MPTEKLAARVAALEHEVARLRNALESGRGGKKPWWEQITGSFARDRMYQEAMRLGQQQRRALRSLTSQLRRGSNARTRHRSS